MNKFRFLSLFSGEPEATTFLSDARQPEVDFLHPSAVTLKKIMGQIVSLKGKTLSNKNLVLPRHVKKKNVHFWLNNVAQKRQLLKLPIDFKCEDCEWDSDYDNHRSEIVIVFDWYEGCRGVILE